MIVCRSCGEIEKIRRSGRATAAALDALIKAVTVGATTKEIDAYAEELIRKQGGEPAFLGYNGFPGSVCASLNEEVVHGLPANRRLVEGDLLKIDIGARVEGWYADMACTVPVGAVSQQARALVDTTRSALQAGIAAVRPGGHVSDIGNAVQAVVEAAGFSVVRALVGHGVGARLHEEPPVPNFGKRGQGPILKPGMVLAIEPMVNVGGWRVRTQPDGWTVVTEDGSLSAHFEHTVAITAGGCEILTVADGLVSAAAAAL